MLRVKKNALYGFTRIIFIHTVKTKKKQKKNTALSRNLLMDSIVDPELSSNKGLKISRIVKAHFVLGFTIRCTKNKTKQC